jgi:hypothetical protein
MMNQTKKFLGVHEKIDNGRCRGPLYQRPDGKIVNMIDTVVDIKLFKLVEFCD